MTMMTESLETIRSSMRAGPIALILEWFETRRETRRLLKELEAMEDHVLADIGLSRTDVLRARYAESGSDPVAILRRARISNSC